VSLVQAESLEILGQTSQRTGKVAANLDHLHAIEARLARKTTWRLLLSCSQSSRCHSALAGMLYPGSVLRKRSK